MVWRNSRTEEGWLRGIHPARTPARGRSEGAPELDQEDGFGVAHAPAGDVIPDSRSINTMTYCL